MTLEWTAGYLAVHKLGSRLAPTDCLRKNMSILHAFIARFHLEFASYLWNIYFYEQELSGSDFLISLHI